MASLAKLSRNQLRNTGWLILSDVKNVLDRSGTFSKNEAYSGVGLDVFGSSVNVTDCDFSENVAYSNNSALAAGGLLATSSPEIRIKGSKINKGKQGAIVIYDCDYVSIEKSEIKANIGTGYAKSGISIYNAEKVDISDCSITANMNGGIFINKSKSAMIERTVVSEGRGLFTGIYLYEAPARLRNSIISQNEGGNDTGVVCGDSDTEIVNCLITGNRSLANGGGLFNYGGICNVYNSTLAKNSGDPAYGPTALIHNNLNGTVMVRNSIIWGNELAKVSDNKESPNNATGSISIVNSLVQGGYPGEGNIDTDPLFVDPENDNFRLKDSSPAINKGDANGLEAILGDRDLDNRPRINGQLDLGPYEFRLESLPVRLVSFSAAVEEKVVLLSWQTDIEENLSLFEIERSLDATNWSKVGSVDKKEGNDDGKSYSFTDTISSLPLSGEDLIPFYYRLRIVDLDGGITYSRIVVVTLSRLDYILSVTGQIYSVKVYPNPVARGKLEVEPAGDIGETAAFRVSDFTGRELLSGEIRGAATIDVSALSPGIYLLYLTRKEEVIVKKVVIQ